MPRLFSGWLIIFAVQPGVVNGWIVSSAATQE